MNRIGRIMVVIVALLSVSGCGGDPLAPLNATISGPASQSFDIEPPGGTFHFVRPLDFQVRDKGGVALTGVQVEFVAGGGGVLVDINGNVIDPNNPVYSVVKTDDRGIARAAFGTTLPLCQTDKDVKIKGGILATVGVSSYLWEVTYTVKQC